LESCPRTLIKRIKEDDLNRILEAGVNRLSIGVQTFNDKILRIAGREHSGKEAQNAVKLARKNGFKNINVDMMIGLPGQSLKTLYRDLEILGELQPESLTLYHLRLKSHVPMYDLLMENRGYFPSEEDSLKMDLMFRDFMNCLGYDEDPINWFNKSPKYRYQHQFDKWEDKKDLIAVGPSAYSFLNNTQYFNHSELDDYYSSLEAGIMPVDVGATLPNDELSRRHMIFKLKTKEGVSKKEHKQLFNVTVDDEFGTQLTALEKLGLVENTPDRVSLTTKGALFADEVARQFYSDEVNRRLQ
jgi:oxygen-independent coproporphyrinogen-3 oxidase